MKRMVLLAACAAMITSVKADEGRPAAWSGGSGTENKTTPVMLSFFTPAELPVGGQSLWDVQGLRFCLPYGRCRTFYGLDLGVVTHSETTFGLQLAAVNLVDSEVRMTLSVGGLANVVRGSYTGFQFGGLSNVVLDDVTALQVSCVNYGGGSLKGLQIGAVNVAPVQAKGLWQIGFWNHGGTFDHCGQIGVFNVVREADTVLQLGLINIIGNNQYPCLPLMNFRF